VGLTWGVIERLETDEIPAGCVPYNALSAVGRRFGVVLVRVVAEGDSVRRPQVLLQYDYDSYQWQFPAAPAEAGDSERDAGA
jgi:hypothetical protein